MQFFKEYGSGNGWIIYIGIMRIIRILLIVIALTVLSISVNAQDRLIFSVAEDVIQAKLAERILKKAYNSIGIQISTIEFPPKRAVYTANLGNVDGELFRIKGIEVEYPNLIMIPVPIINMDWVAFTKSLNIQIVGFENLNSYRIAFRRGIKFAEYGTKGMNRVVLDSLEHAFLLLNNERVDVVIASRIVGSNALKRLKYLEIKVLEPPLKKTYLYHYLHKKHEALVPKITASLQIKHKEGMILKERDYFIKSLHKDTKIEK